jgi:hypothetical protein
MGSFDLDLQAVETELDEAVDGDHSVVLGVLDGTTPPGEWVTAVENGQVLLLHVDGDLNELAAGFARDIRDMGGNLVHFRGFLVVAPPAVRVDNSRLE